MTWEQVKKCKSTKINFEALSCKSLLHNITKIASILKNSLSLKDSFYDLYTKLYY